MRLESAAQAIARARELLGLSASGGDSAWSVRRLDGQGVYYLVHVDARVACLDAGSGALLTSAGTARSPLRVAGDTALALARLGDAAAAELVWRSCAATRSMFDPLWSVSSSRSEVFVDQRGKVWTTLDAKAPGGS